MVGQQLSGEMTGQSAAASATVSFSDAFHLRGGDTACLLIHGFTATPQEMRFLGERLHAAGHSVYGARVAGHGTSIEDLERASWMDWYESVRAQLMELRRHSQHVVVVGQSMGSLLALSLAAQHPAEIAAVAVLAPAIVLQRQWLQLARPLMPLVARLSSPRWRYLPRGTSDIADPAGHVGRETYDRIPLRALHQLLSLQRHVRTQLSRVQQPTLVIHSRQDHTCSPDSVGHLQRVVPGPLEVAMLDASYHVVSVDFDRERVAALVDGFVTRSRVRQPSSAGS